SNRGKATPLFDHLLGDLLELRRHIEAKRLGGFHVDHQFELDGGLHREVGWTLASENSVYICCTALEQVDGIDAVDHHSTVGRVETEWINCGQSIGGCSRKNTMTMHSIQRGGHHYESAALLSRKCSDGRLQIVSRSMKRNTRQFEAKSRR